MDLNDYLAVKKMEVFNERLHDTLELRRRAINNWKRLKVVLAILKICGGRMEKL